MELGHFVTVSSVCEHGQVQLHKGIQLMSPQPFPVRCEACAMQIQSLNKNEWEHKTFFFFKVRGNITEKSKCLYY